MGKTVVVVGGGVSGLFASFILVEKNIRVDLYEKTDKPGKKYLLAGSKHLNITNTEKPEVFLSRYKGGEGSFRKILSSFSPDDLIKWYKDLGIETFTGNRGQVFPLSLSAEEILKRWLSVLEKSPLFSLHKGHRLVEITCDNSLVFQSNEKNITVKTDFAVFALGGGSWPGTGSDGKWKSIFEKKGITVSPLKPANCGFEVSWKKPFINKGEALPLKNIKLSIGNLFSRGEIVLTDYSIEGSGIYSIGHEIREVLLKEGRAFVGIDLFPDLDPESIGRRLEKPRGKTSWSNYLRKTLGIEGVRYSLLRELIPFDGAGNIASDPAVFKNLRLEIIKTRPLVEAISTAGGISFDELDSNMMLKKIPGFYIAGEMADWEAPTGGYLLQGCFSTAYAAAADIEAKLGYIKATFEN